MVGLCVQGCLGVCGEVRVFGGVGCVYVYLMCVWKFQKILFCCANCLIFELNILAVRILQPHNINWSD